MLLVPFLLFIALSGTLSLFMNLPEEDFDGPRPMAESKARFWPGMGILSAGQVLLVSRTISADPSFFKAPGALAELQERSAWIGAIAVAQNGRIAGLSPGTAEREILLSREGSDPKPQGRRRFMRHGLQLAYSWEFSVPGESPATLNFYKDYRENMRAYMLPGIVLLLASMGILILTNGTLTYLVSRSILRPLSRLEKMALRIRDGDLSDIEPETRRKVPEARDSNEFDAAFRAFGEMRARLKDSLERQMAQEDNRRELIAAISHDLRTPLSAIKGYAEGLRDGVAATPEKRGDYLETLLSKAKELDRLIEDLFLFSRLELKDFPYDMRVADFGAYASDILAELAPDFPSLSIEAVPPPGPCPVRFDPLRMGRVFSNIVQNAAAYAARGTGSRATLRVSADISEGSVRIRFSDDGPGIGTEELERVFELFRRLDPSRGKSGAGLGLAIAKLIVEAHGGRIWAEKSEMGGACFAISLPLEGT
jgi:signal transduction histidine kinase